MEKSTTGESKKGQEGDAEKASQTPEEIEAQIKKLQQQLEESKTQDQEGAAEQTAKLEEKASELGAEAGETEAVEEEISQVKEEKVEVIGEAQDEIAETTAETPAEAVEEKEVIEEVSKEKIEESESIEKPVNVEELKNKINSIREKMAETVAVSPDMITLDTQIDLYNSLGKTEEVNKINEYLAKEDERKSKSEQAGFFAGQAGDYYEALGNKEKAEEMYKKSILQVESILQRPDSKDVIGNSYRLANLYTKIGDSDKSLEAYKKIINANENALLGDKNYSVAAKAYEKIGDLENAKKMWEKEAETTKAFEGAKGEFTAEAYEKAGNKEKAEEFYKKAITYQEGNTQSASFDYERLVKAYMGVGEKSKAIKLLKEEAEKMENRGALVGVYRAYELLDKYLNQ